jgi:hypothetical protein
MKVAFPDRAIEALKDAPSAVRTPLHKHIRFLANDLHHPSLRARKYDASRDLWQARVNRDWRFYFTIVGDTYQIEDVIPHPK